MTEDSALSKLNHRQRLFVEEYVARPNATAAAKAAGYSDKTAYSQGQRLLKHVDIAPAIAEARSAAWKRLHMTQDELLALVAGQARNPIGGMLHITPDGDPYIDLSRASPDDLRHVTHVSIEDFTQGRGDDARDVRRVTVKMADPDKARTTLMRHLGLLKDKVEVSVDEDFAAVMEEAARRARAARHNQSGD